MLQLQLSCAVTGYVKVMGAASVKGMTQMTTYTST